MLGVQRIEFNDFNVLKILDLTYPHAPNLPYPACT